MRSLLYVCMVLTISMISFASPSTSVAAGDPQVCLKACMDQNGADQKKSCALQCGYGGEMPRVGGQTKDCGTIYKRCMKTCGTDKSCKTTCREQRTSCY